MSPSNIRRILYDLIETIERAKVYVEHVASGIFVPGMKEFEDINEITMNVNAPINVLSLPGLTNCNKLKEIGVRRFGFGNALSDEVMAFIEKRAAELLSFMDTSCLYEC
ncbi:MAG: isocitrate lyase/phosphoenolpyruvate mutase family protein [Solibacillus sp.]